jgi:2-dehydrotetronate isomerase
MKPHQLSANLGFLWPDRPLLERIEAAANASFAAIELHWPYDIPAEVVREACVRRGLRLLAINTPPGDLAAGEFGLAAVAGRRDAFRDGMARAIAWARTAGAAAIHVMAGVVPEAERPGGAATLIENLKQAGVEAADLTLMLEPINQRDKPGYFYSTLVEAAAIIRAAKMPNLGLMFDAYHVGVAEGGVIEKFKVYRRLVRHLQIAAVPDRQEPDHGDLDYGQFFFDLDALGYSGMVGCEYKPRGDTDVGLIWRAKFGLA